MLAASRGNSQSTEQSTPSFDEVIQTLQSVYVKPKNIILSRNILATRKQKSGETLDQYLNELKALAKNCDFKAVTSEQYKSEMVRDAFINGLLSNNARQRLLENKTLDLQTAYNTARSLDVPQQSSNVYRQGIVPEITAPIQSKCDGGQDGINHSAAMNHKPIHKNNGQSCWFCGHNRHPRRKCPAREVICHKCKKIRHFEKLCRSTSQSADYLCTVAPSDSSKLDDIDNYLCAKAASNSSNSTEKRPFRVITTILINDSFKAEALIDSSSTDQSYINSKLCKILNLKVTPKSKSVGMASGGLVAKSKGHCFVTIPLGNKHYRKDLYIDMILGTDFQEQHESITIQYGGKKPPLTFSALTTMNTEPPGLFAHLSPDCQPIASKSRKYSKTYKEFIDKE